MPLRRMPAGGAKGPVPAPRDNRPPAAKMRARAATAEDMDDEDYEMGEPNMKLSHAIIVVLILHIIAVGGVFAFSSLKNRSIADHKPVKPSAEEAGATAEKEAAAPAAATTAETSPPTAATAKASEPTNAPHGKTHTVAAGETLTSIATANGTTIEAIEKENGITSYSLLHVGQVLKMPGAAAPKATAPVVASTKTTEATTKTGATTTGEVYTVAKGENPYSIAKKLHVSYSELLSYNKITDPKKIQIGQKLKVPPKKS